MDENPFYKRRLPHWHPVGQIFFITFRLANSLPSKIIRVLQDERDAKRREILNRFQDNRKRQELESLENKYFEQFDSWLDRCVTESPRWLEQENIARIVTEQVHILDGERYRLIAYCIMFNHGHLLIDTANYLSANIPLHRGLTASYPLADTLKLLKGRTARYCNQALQRNGAFWHHESYDHVVRDEIEYERIIRYILDNPVKAGLEDHWEDWPFTYCAE